MRAEQNEANKAIFRRFYERAWNGGDPTAADDYLAPTFANHMLPAGVADHRAAYREAILDNRRSFPDYVLEIADIVGDGNQVAAHWRSRCTVGPGAPPGLAPGTSLTINGMTLVRILDGHITDFWKYDNAATVLAAAGTQPPAG